MKGAIHSCRVPRGGSVVLVAETAEPVASEDDRGRYRLPRSHFLVDASRYDFVVRTVEPRSATPGRRNLKIDHAHEVVTDVDTLTAGRVVVPLELRSSRG